MRTTTLTRPKTPSATNGSGPQVRPAPVLPPPKRRKRPALLAAGIILVVAGGLSAYALASSMSTRTAVVVAASDIAWGETIAVGDLASAQVAADPVLARIPWTDRATVIGQRAGTDIHHGSLIGPADLMTGQIPPVGQALVGVAVKPGQLPATPLTPGQRIIVTRNTADTHAAPEAAAPMAVDAVVLTVGDVDAGGARTVDVLVAQDDATALTQWSAAGAASIVVVPGR